MGVLFCRAGAILEGGPLVSLLAYLLGGTMALVMRELSELEALVGARDGDPIGFTNVGWFVKMLAGEFLYSLRLSLIASWTVDCACWRYWM